MTGVRNHVVIRPINSRDELEACYDLWARVFPEERAFFQRRLDFDSSYHFETTWVAYVDGTLAAAVQIFPYETNVGGVPIKVGGIGNVATAPEFRHQGLARTILRAQSQWMQLNGYDASLLFTNIYEFYGQVGWGTATVPYWTVPRALFDSIELKGPSTCRKADERDLAGLIRVYNAWLPGRTQARMRTDAYWQDAQNWLRADTWVFESGDEVVAYARARLQNGSTVQVTESCYKDGHEQAARDLMWHVIQQFPTSDAVQMTLPADHVLVHDLAALGVEPESDVVMWKAFDSRRLVERLQPVLSHRVREAMKSETAPMPRQQCELHHAVQSQNAQVNQKVLLECVDSDILLTVSEYGVEMQNSYSETIEYDERTRCGAAHLVQMILTGAKTSDPPTIQMLFPRQSGVLWPTDFF